MPSRTHVHRKLHSWTFTPCLQFFGGGIYAPDPSTYDPIEILLNASSEDERDRLTARWRDNKLSELSFVGVVVSWVGSFVFVVVLGLFLRWVEMGWVKGRGRACWGVRGRRRGVSVLL